VCEGARERERKLNCKTVVAATSPLEVYSDGALQSGFSDWSWSTNYSLASSVDEYLGLYLFFHFISSI
jgi:hypothetical protein